MHADSVTVSLTAYISTMLQQNLHSLIVATRSSRMQWRPATTLKHNIRRISFG
jgi:hypothetical protein